METILVPTDYSAAAKNAALYAISLAAQLQAKKIVLYNAYQAAPVIAETAVAPATTLPFFNIESLRDVSNMGMRQFKDSIQDFCPADVEIDQQTEYAILDSGIDDICEKLQADLIVLGITGTSKLEEVLIGSTAITIAKNCTIPVIVVPEEAKYRPVKNIVLACDFKKVVETTPVVPIKNMLNATKAVLHIVNIYQSEDEITAAKTYQQELLNSILQEYNPHFHFEYNTDFIAGINAFAEVNSIDLIISIPKKHSFFEALFKERHIKKLAFHSNVPLMYIH